VRNARARNLPDDESAGVAIENPAPLLGRDLWIARQRDACDTRPPVWVRERNTLGGVRAALEVFVLAWDIPRMSAEISRELAGQTKVRLAVAGGAPADSWDPRCGLVDVEFFLDNLAGYLEDEGLVLVRRAAGTGSLTKKWAKHGWDYWRDIRLTLTNWRLLGKDECQVQRRKQLKKFQSDLRELEEELFKDLLLSALSFLGCTEAWNWMRRLWAKTGKAADDRSSTISNWMWGRCVSLHAVGEATDLELELGRELTADELRAVLKEKGRERTETAEEILAALRGTTTAEQHADYEEYCDNAGVQSLSVKAFSIELDKIPGLAAVEFARKGEKRARGRRGIGLRKEATTQI